MYSVSQFTESFLKHAKELPGDFARPSGRTILAHGLCWYYAYVFSKVLGGKVYSYQNQEGSGHCFIKLQGKFYDSENEEGIDSWKKLQRYMNRASARNLTIHRSLGGIASSWRVPESHLEIFDSVAELVKADLQKQ